MTAVNLTRGVYRRIYAGFVTGRRINSVSVSAECLFWRLHAVADDYGNLRADPVVLKCAAYPKRKIGPAMVDALLTELVDARLVRRYEVDGEVYCRILDFEMLQPCGKNGRRMQRVPGESGGVPDNPGPSSASESQSQSQSQSDTENHSEPEAEAGSTRGASGVAGWLAKHGVAEPAFSEIAAMEVSVAALERDWADSSRGARRPIPVFVAKVKKRLGIHRSDNRIVGTIGTEVTKTAELVKANEHLKRVRAAGGAA